MPTLSIGGKTCFYRDSGKGFPLLFGHSYLWTSEMWEPQLNTLSQNYRCIAVDLWDHGNSGHLNEKNYTLEQLADDHWQLMEHLNISEFALIGLSVGGMWGTHLALKHPEAIKALVLMDTYVGSEPPATQQQYFAMLDLIERCQCIPDPLLDRIVPLYFSPHTLVHQKDLVAQFRASLANMDKKRLPGIIALGRTIFSRQCLLDQLPQLTIPTLLLVGQDDIPRPPSETEEMLKRLPQAEMHLIENAGHISTIEQPEKVTQLLLHFLNHINVYL